MLSCVTINIENRLYDKKADLYLDDSVRQKAVLLYFHGGGLLFGSRDDLPKLHIDTFCSAGYAVLAFDYPLAPSAKLDTILEDCINSVIFYLKKRNKLFGFNIPYFLFGRSAGAYLALLTGRENFSEPPRGLLSYYGYAFLCDKWYKTPSPFYLKMPEVSEECLNAVPKTPHAFGDYETHYAVYVYARQSGKWPQIFFGGKEKNLLADYSLRLCAKYPCRIFCAHSSNDTDVPFEEFNALCEKYDVKDRVIAAEKMHDFDRMENSASTRRLLSKSVDFLNSSL